MPINLTKLMQTANSTTPKLKFNAHYFHKDLTGMGKKVGLINQYTDTLIGQHKLYQANKNLEYLDQPQNNKQIITTMYNQDMDLVNLLFDRINTNYTVIKKHTYVTSPIDAFDTNLYYTYHTDQLPKFIQHLDFIQDVGDPQTYWTGIIHDVKYYKYENDRHDLTKEQFFARIYPVVKTIGKKQDKTTLQICNNYSHVQDKPQYDTITIITNQEIYNDAIQNLKLSEVFKQQAKDTEEHMFDDIADLIKLTWCSDNSDDLVANLISHNYHLFKTQDGRRSAKDYQRFYNKIESRTLKHKQYKHPQRQYNLYKFNKVINANIRLSLTRQLTLLKQDHNVYQFNPSQATLQTNDKYSPEQLAIIHSTAPYSVGVAGAGSGKSHTLIGRLEFLKQNNVDFSHVLVTSFTNTAAQNIIDRFHSGINSLTNANLFHKIYQANFSHTLTNDETLINLLSILPDKSKLMKKNNTIDNVKYQLIDYLKKSITTSFQKVDIQSVTERLVALVSQHFNDVIDILNAVNQTTLLLEPIIINTMLQNQMNITYPGNLKDLNFILTDESQDTSAFEYVLLLQLAQINHAQLMIIGDANQTLYEFRNANPRFLNTLERSDVFKTYTMSTNYRSKQDILTMANQFLDVMTTNETANIQLHANILAKTDLNTFRSHVKLANLVLDKSLPIRPKSHETPKQALLRESVTQRDDLKDWVVDHYKNNEQIAIMAYRNRDTQAIADAVSEMIFNETGTRPEIGYTRVPQRRADTWLSQAMTYDDNVLAQKFPLTVVDVAKSIKRRLDHVAQKRTNRQYTATPSKSSLSIAKKFSKSGGLATHVRLYNQHKISYTQFNGYIKLTLIRQETYKNNTARIVQDVNETHWQDKPIVVSTIHSAKGLEFDNVICYFDETMRNATSQENLRLYGVALTRAENNEFIINRPKVHFVQSARRELPTEVNNDIVGMFKTPMRTAYNRCVINFKTQQTGNQQSSNSSDSQN